MEPGFFKEITGLGLGLGKSNLSQDYPIGPESKEVLKKQRDEDISKGHRAANGQGRNNLSNKRNSTTLDYK